MNRRHHPRRFLRAAYRGPVVALAALVLSVGAIAATTGTAAVAADGVVLRGAGATFPFPVYARWAEQYRRETGVEVVYVPAGSAAGIDQLEQRLVDFAGTDVPPDAAARQRAGVFAFPAVIGGVVPVINITGIKSAALRLTGQVLGDIYLGTIRKWNDPAIVALNPDLDLPASNITVVHRADASGTTFLWSSFLSRANPAWRAAVGGGSGGGSSSLSMPSWPVGEAVVGNEGIASTVRRTRMSIGYVEYAYALQRGLGVASLRNHDGQFVAPAAAAFEAAARAARWRSAGDLEQSLIDEAGAASWPITGASFIVVPAGPGEASRSADVFRFFDWAMRHGQRLGAELGYVSLPAEAVGLVDALWEARAGVKDGTAASAPGAR